MLRIENLAKRHGENVVFQGLTHRFGTGCVAFCDEDRTGKSTLLALVAGAMPPDSGEIRVGGHSVAQEPGVAGPRVAWIPENCLALPEQTGREMLEQVAAARNAEFDDDAFDLAFELGLEAHLDKRFEQMSTGTRRKVYLVTAALGDPLVVVADGPSDGLDARARAVVAGLFDHWAQSRAVLFASHDPDFVRACAGTLARITPNSITQEAL